MSGLQAHAAYALAWTAFGIVHSALASETVKGRLRPFAGRYYRLSYNIVGLVTTALVMAFGALLFPNKAPFDLPEWFFVVQTVLFLFGWGVMIIGARCYDMRRFAGVSQLRESDGGEGDEEALTTRCLLAYIRHPLYAAGFLILWGSAVNELGLATAVWGSLYLWVGTMLEERRLLRMHGESYAAYRREVPAYIPWKGRVREP